MLTGYTRAADCIICPKISNCEVNNKFIQPLLDDAQYAIEQSKFE